MNYVVCFLLAFGGSKIGIKCGKKFKFISETIFSKHPYWDLLRAIALLSYQILPHSRRLLQSHM